MTTDDWQPIPRHTQEHALDSIGDTIWDDEAGERVPYVPMRRHNSLLDRLANSRQGTEERQFAEGVAELHHQANGMPGNWQSVSRATKLSVALGLLNELSYRTDAGGDEVAVSVLLESGSRGNFRGTEAELMKFAAALVAAVADQ